jgi:hypothetical protein
VGLAQLITRPASQAAAQSGDDVPNIKANPPEANAEIHPLLEALDPIRGKVTIGRRFFVTSLPSEAGLIACCLRWYWQVEHNLPCRLDVIFREDLQRCRRGDAATNPSLMRKMNLNLLLKANPPGMSLKRMRPHPARKLDQLTKIIAPMLEKTLTSLMRRPGGDFGSRSIHDCTE